MTEAQACREPSWENAVKTLRIRLAVVGLGLAAMCGAASGAETRPFDRAGFDAAQAKGRAIVVDISAPWCPTCAAQKPTIDRLAASDEFKDLLILGVDFDSQKDVVRDLGARMQSTLIAYNGKSETARSVGDIKPASIEALFRSAVAK